MASIPIPIPKETSDVVTGMFGKRKISNNLHTPRHMPIKPTAMIKE